MRGSEDFIVGGSLLLFPQMFISHFLSPESLSLPLAKKTWGNKNWNGRFYSVLDKNYLQAFRRRKMMGKQKAINTKIKMEELPWGTERFCIKEKSIKVHLPSPENPPHECSQDRHPCEEHPSGSVYFTTRRWDQMAQHGDFISECKWFCKSEDEAFWVSTAS